MINVGGKVATATVFDENVGVSNILIDVASYYNAVMMKVHENVSAHCCCQAGIKLEDLVKTHTSGTILFAHPLKVEFLSRKYLQEGP